MPVNWEVLKIVFFVTDEEGDEWFNMVYFPRACRNDQCCDNWVRSCIHWYSD